MEEIEILDIINTKKEIEMWDLQVEDTHNFILKNGIITHNSGKTNNLIALLKDYRKNNSKTKIYLYGFNEVGLKYLKKLKNIFEISSLEQLSNKKDCLIIIEEFQRLKLNDRRYKETLNEFVDFIYHNNNWVVFCSPNIREFNSIVGAKIEKWALKSLNLKDVVNGSQLKEEVLNYNGRYKVLKNIRIDKNKLLIINDEYEKVLELEYIKEVDTKKENLDIFEKTDIKKLSKKLSKKKSGLS